VNLTGTFLCLREVLPAMATKGEGRIVNVASTAGLKGYRNLSAYCASKHGIIGPTRALALEVAAAGVTVNSVCPTYTVEAGMGEKALENVMGKLNTDRAGAIKALARGIPRGSLVTPAEVANAVVWLCSPDAAGVTGQSIVVAGGEVM
jgi:3-hydroxybutyrate dehydrogenase